MKKSVLIGILVFTIMSVAVFAAASTVSTSEQQYDAIKQQLLGLMTADQKTAFLAMPDAQQRQYVNQQIALANLRWQSEANVTCGGVCVEGLPALWQVRLSNVGQSEFHLDSVSLIDDSNNIFAQRLVNLTIPVNQAGTIGLQGILPPPSRGSTLYYKVVYVINQNVQSEQSNRRLMVMPMSDVECSSNSTCAKDEWCAGYKCLPLTSLPANMTGRPANILASGSAFYPIVIILLLLAIIFLLLSKHKKKKEN